MKQIYKIIIYYGLTFFIGTLITICLNINNKNINDIVSSFLGWIYFSAWSLSYYPQIILNYQNKNVEGISIDYYAYNIFDVSTYLLYNIFFYYNKTIQNQYKSFFHKSNLVEINDVAFSLHGFTLVCLTIFQIFYYNPKKKLSKTTIIIFSIIFTLLSIYFICCVKINSIYFSGMMFFYVLSIFKIILTIMKYTPQIYHNYKRNNTDGFAISNPLLDILGGIFSLSQVLFDSIIYHNSNGLLGDIVKLLLGILTIFFDIIFITQHFFLYKKNKKINNVYELYDDLPE